MCPHDDPIHPSPLPPRWFVGETDPEIRVDGLRPPAAPAPGWLDRLLIRLLRRPAVQAAVVAIVARDRAQRGGDWRLAPDVVVGAVAAKPSRS